MYTCIIFQKHKSAVFFLVLDNVLTFFCHKTSILLGTFLKSQMETIWWALWSKIVFYVQTKQKSWNWIPNPSSIVEPIKTWIPLCLTMESNELQEAKPCAYKKESVFGQKSFVAEEMGLVTKLTALWVFPLKAH